MNIYFSYWIAVIALTSVLIWGLRLLSKELKSPGNDNKTLLANALSEKINKDDDGVKEASFSRVAGALGAVSLAATFTGIGYWAIYQLYFGQDLKKMSDMTTYFLAGSALFLPYAFNQISNIFKS